MAMCYCIR